MEHSCFSRNLHEILQRTPSRLASHLLVSTSFHDKGTVAEVPITRKAEDLKLWRLCQREKPIQKLTKGKVVLIGDAAHPMLPHQGQGGGMAIEDGAALGVLLSDLGSKAEVTDRLALFERLRLDRVSAMQVFSSVGQDESAKIADIARPYVRGPLPSKYIFSGRSPSTPFWHLN